MELNEFLNDINLECNNMDDRIPIKAYQLDQKRIGNDKILGIKDQLKVDGIKSCDYFLENDEILLIIEISDFFKQAVIRAYGKGCKNFEEISFIKAFLKACQGFEDKPIHYPRTTKEPRPHGENFKWFVANEKAGEYALQDLAQDNGLPILKG